MDNENEPTAESIIAANKDDLAKWPFDLVLAHLISWAAALHERSYVPAPSHAGVDMTGHYEKDIRQAATEICTAAGWPNLTEPIAALLVMAWNDGVEWAERLMVLHASSCGNVVRILRPDER